MSTAQPSIGEQVEPPARSRGYLPLVLAASTMAMVMSMLQTMVVPLLGNISSHLHVSIAAAGWVLTSNLLAAAVLTPVIGRLGDTYGRRRVLLIVLAVVTLGCLIAATATTLAVLILARVLQASVFGLFPIAISILRDELPAERLLPGIAITSAMLGVSNGLGLIFTGVLTSNGADFRRVFWLSFGLAAFALLVAVRVFPSRPTSSVDRTVDWVGAVLLGSALVLLLLPVSQGHVWGWASARTLACLLASAVTFTTFVLVEARVRVPLVALTLLTQRRMVAAHVASLLLGGAIYASFLGISGLVQTPSRLGYGFDATVLRTSVLYLLPGSLVAILLSPLAGRGIVRFGPRLVLVCATMFGAAGYVLLLAFHAHPWQVVLFGTWANAGVGPALAAIPAVIVQAVAPAQMGVANGLNVIMRTIGASLASAVSVTIIASVVLAGTDRASEGAYEIIFAIGAGCYVLSALVCLRVLAAPEPAQI